MVGRADDSSENTEVGKVKHLFFFLAILSCMVLTACSTSPTPDLEATVEDISPQTITTDKGTVQVPGTAYIDGRDPSASPPLTIKSINIWDSVQRTKGVCKLEHGTKVDLLDAKQRPEESRYYFLVHTSSCEGWLPEPFLSREYQEPVGDWF